MNIREVLRRQDIRQATKNDIKAMSCSHRIPYKTSTLSNNPALTREPSSPTHSQNVLGDSGESHIRLRYHSSLNQNVRFKGVASVEKWDNRDCCLMKVVDVFSEDVVCQQNLTHPNDSNFLVCAPDLVLPLLRVSLVE